MRMIIAVLFAVFITEISVAQSPQKMKFQAVARDNSGNILANRRVSFKISILSGSASGAVAYSETQDGLSTNTFGLVEMEIGNGTPETGVFSSVNWGTNSYFVRVEMDPAGGSAYQVLSTSQLLSVPYALHAKTAENVDDADADPFNEIQSLSISGDQLTLNKGGGTVSLPSNGGGLTLPYSGIVSSENSAFTVTNTGSAIYGYSSSASGSSNGIYGSSDSPGGTGVYGDAPVTAIQGSAYSESEKNSRGVSGYTLSLGDNSSGVYGLAMNTEGFVYGVRGETNSSKGAGVYGKTNGNVGGSGVFGVAISSNGTGVKGQAPAMAIDGFASSTTELATGVSGIVQSAVEYSSGVYGKATASNGYVFGVRGETNSNNGAAVWGISNATSGAASGLMGFAHSPDGYGVLSYGLTTGIKGIAESFTLKGVGVYGTAYSNENGTCGVYGIAENGIGDTYGVYGESYSSSGTGIRGINKRMSGTTFGIEGVVFSPDGYSGYFTGPKFYVNGRVGIGENLPLAGLHIRGHSYPESFMFLEADNGFDAGIRLYEGSTAQWHIFNNAAGGGLHIYNSAVKTAIFAKQSNSYVGIGHTNPAYQLHVGGDAAKTTGSTVWIISSDKRLKDVTGDYLKGLNEIALLNPVKFRYKTGNIRNLPSEKEYVGFIAQDVKEIFPESVSLSADGYYDMDIHAINVALVNAVKELKAENEKLKEENRIRDMRLEKLEKILSGYTAKYESK